MIYDLAQPLYCNGQQFPFQLDNAHFPVLYKAKLPCTSGLPPSHFRERWRAIDLIQTQALHRIDAMTSRKHESLTPLSYTSSDDAGYGHLTDMRLLIAGTGGAWVGPVVWNIGDLDSEGPASEQRTEVSPSVADLIAIERGPR